MAHTSEGPRIALYSHDTMGLGHVRRNLMIGRALARSSLRPNVLLLSGAVDAKSFYLPEGVDIVTLPSLYKDKEGGYTSRRLRMSLPEIISLRRKILRAAVQAFDPHLLIVDNAPRGVSGELEPTLELLRSEKRASVVLGIRDILDEPAAILREWDAKDNWGAIRRHFDEVWVYGDRSVWDVVNEYRVEEDIAGKFRYTGYLGRNADALDPAIDYAGDSPEYSTVPFVLCLMGGGQDGMQLAESFIDAETPQGRIGVLITGPFIDPRNLEKLRSRASRKGNLRVIDFLPEPLTFVRKAESIVSMGGYNAVCEIMSFSKRALIVPRVSPRKEQLVRAERLSALGAVDFLHPDNLSPGRITEFLKSAPGRHPPRTPVDMDGLAKVTKMTRSLLEGLSVGDPMMEGQRNDRNL